MARGKNTVSPEVAQRLVDLAREMQQSPSHSKSSRLKITTSVAHHFFASVACSDKLQAQWRDVSFPLPCDVKNQRS